MRKRGEGYLISQVTQAVGQTCGEFYRVEALKVVGTKVMPPEIAGEHLVDAAQYGSGQCDGGAFDVLLGGDSPEKRLKVAAAGSRSSCC